jgi:hypothetical protein
MIYYVREGQDCAVQRHMFVVYLNTTMLFGLSWTFVYESY